MQSKARPTLDWLIAIVLILGLFPSATSLSGSFKEAHPQLGRYLGPLNPLKVAAPLLLYYVWIHRQAFSRRFWTVFLGAFALLTVATFIAGIPCGFPPALLREWAVISIGFLAAFCLLSLPQNQVRLVLLLWSLILYGSCLLDVFVPATLDWLYANVFDPNTRALDLPEVGKGVLTGIFGRQSVAKLLAWMPWLLMAFFFRKPLFSWRSKALWALAIFSTGAILATSQRGPFVGALAGWAAFALHQQFQLKNRKIAFSALTALGLSILTTVVVVPRSILEPRMKSILGLTSEKQESSPALSLSDSQVPPVAQPDPESVYTHQADVNRSFRKTMAIFSIRVIATHPLGHACISDHEFRAAGIAHFNHAHNLILQQFRERGWLLGTAHLFLWLLALLGAWRTRSDAGSAMTAGIIVILVSGLFDHPWFVLNHAMVLAVFLGIGIKNYFLTPPRKKLA